MFIFETSFRFHSFLFPVRIYANKCSYVVDDLHYAWCTRILYLWCMFIPSNLLTIFSRSVKQFLLPYQTSQTFELWSIISPILNILYLPDTERNSVAIFCDTFISKVNIKICFSYKIEANNVQTMFFIVFYLC